MTNTLMSGLMTVQLKGWELCRLPPSCPQVINQKTLQLLEKYGERGRIRTCDPCLKRALLYQLSYAPNSFAVKYYCDSTTLSVAQPLHNFEKLRLDVGCNQLHVNERF